MEDTMGFDIDFQRYHITMGQRVRRAFDAGVDRRLLVLAACDCSRTVLHLVEDDRTSAAVEAVEAWCKGENVPGEIADAATYSAEAAADARAYADGAADVAAAAAAAADVAAAVAARSGEAAAAWSVAAAADGAARRAMRAYRVAAAVRWIVWSTDPDPTEEGRAARYWLAEAVGSLASAGNPAKMAVAVRDRLGPARMSQAVLTHGSDDDGGR